MTRHVCEKQLLSKRTLWWTSLFAGMYVHRPFLERGPTHKIHSPKDKLPTHAFEKMLSHPFSSCRSLVCKLTRESRKGAKRRVPGQSRVKPGRNFGRQTKQKTTVLGGPPPKKTHPYEKLLVYTRWTSHVQIPLLAGALFFGLRNGADLRRFSVEASCQLYRWKGHLRRKMNHIAEPPCIRGISCWGKILLFLHGGSTC